MNNVIRGFLALAFTGLLGCAVTPAEDGNAEDTGQTSEALANVFGNVFYYSDSTYTTIVGERTSNCDGGTSSEGRKTVFAKGAFDSCSGRGVSYGCYQVECPPPGKPGGCSSTCDYTSCVNC